MALVYLSLGSNLGDRKTYLTKAIELIEQEIGPVTARSAFYETKPWGYESDHLFLNACIAAETALSPSDCLLHLKEGERRLGRLKIADSRYSDRVIDMDILFYDNLILNEPGLVIPHPLMHHRSFVLKPLVEIAPEFIHPVLKKSMLELLESLSSLP
ncbi:MAG: 2-amino-4-hydroxy-6-hydroxymethyldihydropteridine diphosphokinase [Bacteroidota bacterium]|nr:2-amino-4-hydroxy-6-hydroxymethyldihydropteridine diphosphokinase [Bacteroidota bacterium]